LLQVEYACPDPKATLILKETVPKSIILMLLGTAGRSISSSRTLWLSRSHRFVELRVDAHGDDVCRPVLEGHVAVGIVAGAVHAEPLADVGRRISIGADQLAELGARELFDHLPDGIPARRVVPLRQEIEVAIGEQLVLLDDLRSEYFRVRLVDQDLGGLGTARC
jgi:hypothetical protein